MDLPDFRGRTVCIYLTGKQASEGMYLVDPVLCDYCGRWFLVGSTPGTWGAMAHLEMAVAWDRVESYLVGDSIDTFTQARAK